jgi:hypothetical protein
MIYHAKPPSPIVRRGHPLANGLVRFYGMTERGGTILRDFARRTHATLSNGATFGTGPYGRAVTLAGSPQNATASDAGLASGAAPRTLAAWFRTTQGSDGMLWQSGTNLNNQAWNLLVNFGPLMIDGWAAQVQSTANVNDGRPHLGVGTYDGATIRLYLDGVLQGSLGVTLSTTNTGTVYIGSQLLVGRYYQGSFDALAYWTRCLSPSEIAGLGPDPCAMLRPRRLVPILAASAGGPIFRRTPYRFRVGSRGVA